ncbi:MAG: DUF11 domain-containing protein, partial [Planctomycetales bacterium]
QVAPESSAGFAPAGAPAIEVPTDAEGRATAEIFQKQSQRADVPIQIEVIRPGRVASAADRRLVLGRGSTTMTWTAAAVGISMTGPNEIIIGSKANYRIQVNNSGDLPLTNVIVSSRVPSQLQYESSSSNAGESAKNLKWQLDKLAAGDSRTIDVQYQVVQEGELSNCATVTAAEKVRAEHCVVTKVLQAGPEMSVNGPETATVGDQIIFMISVTNRSSTTLNDLVLIDRYDDGLKHANPSPIEQSLGSIAPGQTLDDIRIALNVLRPGRLCQTIELAGTGIQKISRTVCITVAAAPNEMPDTSSAKLQVTKRGPSVANVGDKVMFEVQVTNTGGSVVRDITVVDTYQKPGFAPTRVSEGYLPQETELTWKAAELNPGKSFTVQVEAMCTVAGQACSTATVTATGDIQIVE